MTLKGFTRGGLPTLPGKELITTLKSFTVQALAEICSRSGLHALPDVKSITSVKGFTV
jgi:hypothetical protein